ncbi:solute carrier family 49 member 4 homolog isoform X2 [Eriocheir sinensis]|uniref:solute carrier family 49 member 4 homolog isoform X2 n=1 Tax=Eriocheir sinensis TaxID=95602 RepID=UPI0021C6A9A8|nr:solute carrier family 49 member 4 homolog isoform X2 [Eriocheir sinensis]
MSNAVRQVRSCEELAADEQPKHVEVRGGRGPNGEMELEPLLEQEGAHKHQTERGPLPERHEKLSPSPTLHPHNQHPSPTTIATAATTTPAAPVTPSAQDTEDKVDGVLFNNSPYLVGRGSTPHHGGGPARKHPLYGPEDPFAPPQEAATKKYARRFWILGSFSFLAMFQCLMWNTWGPLSASMDAAYPGWGSDTVAMMGNWGTITFVVFVAPMCWIMSTRGLRVGVLVCCTLVAAGVVLRVLPILFSDNVTFFTVMCHVCAILVGTAGTLIMAAPPLIAAVWFPPKQRTTATGAVVGVAILVAVYLYFPAKPPTPPSLTSHVERLDFRAGVKMMARNRELLLVTLSYSLCLGVPSAWTSVLNFSLYELGMTQNDAMWVGLSTTLSSGLLALVVGRLTDLMYGYIKLTLLIFLAVNIALFYWFFLLTWGSIPVSIWQIYVTVVGGVAFNFSTCPLFFELAVESAYPCSEVMVGGIMTGANNFVGLCFLFLFFIPFESYQWVTYVLLATQGLCLIPFVFVKENYSRSNIDRSDPASAYQPFNELSSPSNAT